jgi:hypothetical protein
MLTGNRLFVSLKPLQIMPPPFIQARDCLALHCPLCNREVETSMGPFIPWEEGGTKYNSSDEDPFRFQSLGMSAVRDQGPDGFTRPAKIAMLVVNMFCVKWLGTFV